VAGAASLVKEAFPSYSPAQIKSFLEGRAVALGAPDKDNIYGSGRLDLGSPPACDPGVDTDSDGFDNDVECYVGTDPLDACPDVVGSSGLCPGPSCDGDDAWPPDLNVDRGANIVDVLLFKPVIMTHVGDDAYNPRFDLDANGDINIVDVLLYKPVIMTSCTP
jgi:hypothetical protein